MVEEQSTNKLHFNKFKSSINVKIIIVGVLTVVLLIPFGMIQSLIGERETRRNEAVEEISGKWGNAQTVSGPILTIPYNTYTVKNGIRIPSGKKYAYFLPEELNLNGNIDTEIRYRGIYEAILYNTKLALDGRFKFPDFSEWEIANEDVLWNEAFLTIGITDMRGIKDNPVIVWNKKALSPVPGSKITNIIESGISSNVPSINIENKNNIPFNIILDINGSKDFNFIPFGKKVNVDLQSKWADPAFSGMFLPEERKITKDGFKAKWKILHFNRSFPQKWLKTQYDFEKSSFGVTLLLPVNEYQKISRTAKYAILFISLTFLTFFLIEILNKKRLHPIQYLLIGFALCLFYTLLLSITEHFNFNIAYLSASVGIVSMISLYTKSALKSTKMALFVGMLVSILYSLLFIILQQQDYALLIGSTGLFVILGIVMFVTRGINWYSIGTKKNI